MAKYYNVLRTPLPLTLRKSGPICVQPKSWITLSQEDEGSLDIIRNLKKRFLVRRDDTMVASSKEPLDLSVPELSQEKMTNDKEIKKESPKIEADKPLEKNPDEKSSNPQDSEKTRSKRSPRRSRKRTADN